MRLRRQAVTSLAIAVVLGIAASASALTLTGGPVYTLTGGGSCSASGQPSRGGGATVTCTGVNLAAHTHVYFGIKNNSSVIGAATDGTGPTASELFTATTSSGANTITYTGASSSVTSACAAGGCAYGTDTVTTTLTLTRTAGTATVVGASGNPTNNSNGDIDFLFRLDSGTSFTFDVDITGSHPDLGAGQVCTGIYDADHATTSPGGCLSRVDVAFYYSDCGDGQTDSPEQCDDGVNNGTAGSCCTTSCTFKSNGTACTDDGIQCTNDQCNGASNICQHPNKTAGTSCSGNGANECSGADTCNGSGSCLNNDVAPGTTCTDTSPPGTNSANQCKDAQCNGTGTCSQTFANETNGTACADGNFCTTGDTCQSGACSAGGGSPCDGPDGDVDCSETCVDVGFETGNCDGNDPNGSACTDGLFCTGTDTCNSGNCSVHTGDPCSGPDGDTNCSESCDEGADNCTAADADGTLCRTGSGDSCDPNETCLGGSCPADTVTSGGTLCRAGSGDSCDADETCTGVAGQACPGDDAPGNAGVVCRASSAGDACDLSETCTGVPTEDCPDDDAPANAGVECRAAAGECDVAEQCTGTPNDSCPADGFITAGTGCTDDGEICTTDLCDGAGACAHDPGNAGTSCRAPAQTCDAEEFCDGVVGTCPADVNEPDGTSCSDGAFCNGPEECQAGSCTDTADPCAVLCDEINDQCTVACGDEPTAGCRTALKSILLIKDDTDNSKDKLIYKFIKGQSTTQAEFGDPLHSADYALCIYAGMMGGTAVSVFDAVVQSDTANWKAISTKGYKYKDANGGDDGVQKVILKGDPTDPKTKILVKGRGANLPDLDPGTLPFITADYPIIAQVTNSETGVCWESTFNSNDVKKNVATQFKAKDQ